MYIKKLLEFQNNIALTRTFESLRKEFSYRQDSSMPIIIVFANYSYIDIVLNWIESLKKINLSNYIILSMDSKIYRILNQKSINTVRVKVGNNLKDIWKTRIKIFRFLIDSGYDFIHSDADAVWLQNPITEYFDLYQNLDIIASQGTIFPHSVLNKWGFVLCCGLFFVRSNQQTSKLFKEVEDNVLQTNDDQKSLNIVLASKNIVWEFQEQYQISFRNSTFNYSNQMVYGKGDNIQVGLLPFKQFPRLVKYQKNPYVVHTLTPKNALEKKEKFKNLGLWFLKTES
ncbi:MAG: putative nucleotide-diphospho-sugar transferase [Xenococcaceae cyanobacterium MO_167.B27]|nr:putative nucleotide-diphospho-sugar transferase [Xenococcaceae cyanobacterium MO_167.B27]